MTLYWFSDDNLGGDADDEPMHASLPANHVATLEALRRDAEASGDRRTAQILRERRAGYGVYQIAWRLRVSRAVVYRVLAKVAESLAEKSTQPPPGAADGLR